MLAVGGFLSSPVGSVIDRNHNAVQCSSAPSVERLPQLRPRKSAVGHAGLRDLGDDVDELKSSLAPAEQLAAPLSPHQPTLPTVSATVRSKPLCP